MKISINKKQKEELDRYLAARDKETAIDDWFNEQFDFSMYKELKKLSASDFARVIVEGYDLEETPEDKLRIIYEKHYANGEYSIVDGIEKTLIILGIKIKGINE